LISSIVRSLRAGFCCEKVEALREKNSARRMTKDDDDISAEILSRARR
jgi:hypothetical protein